MRFTSLCETRQRVVFCCFVPLFFSKLFLLMSWFSPSFLTHLDPWISGPL